MKLANDEAIKNLNNQFKDGGPFGAVIVKDGKVIAKAHNTVLKDKDATAHAEINAIRLASKQLQTHDLKGCTLYTSCYPCPMCFSAIIWSNIDTVYFGNTKEDAAEIGFRDDYIYKIINDPNKGLKIQNMDSDETIKVFKEFEKYKNLY